MRGSDQRIRAESRSAWISRMQPVERVYGFASASEHDRRYLLAAADNTTGEGLYGPFGGCPNGVKHSVGKRPGVANLGRNTADARCNEPGVSGPVCRRVNQPGAEY